MMQIVDKILVYKKWAEINEVAFIDNSKPYPQPVQMREIYTRGDAAAILLYNNENATVILTKQFRLATLMNVYKSELKNFEKTT